MEHCGDKGFHNQDAFHYAPALEVLPEGPGGKIQEAFNRYGDFPQIQGRMADGLQHAEFEIGEGIRWKHFNGEMDQ